jgi:hypothetical protein
LGATGTQANDRVGPDGNGHAPKARQCRVRRAWKSVVLALALPVERLLALFSPLSLGGHAARPARASAKVARRSQALGKMGNCHTPPINRPHSGA